MPDMDGLISKLQDATFARGFVEGMRRDAADLGGRIAELEAALRLIAEAAPLIGGDAYAMRNIAREALGEKI